MTDLITRAKEYLSKTEGITEGAWTYYPSNPNVQIYKDDGIDEGEYIQSTEKDVQAMALTPTARKLILELANEVMLLRKWVDLEPKDGFDDEIEIYKRLAKR